ncbi:MAG: DUF3786 domain-containing protein [Desulfobacca sp.]|uniref:DUF3786 domain-containing protein n=1 Tax=Desulfobacca sp. TaxID=2067990 RepID=UPI004048FE4C
MPQKSKTPVEIYQLLDKSNCRQCGEKTCLAFASAVYLNQRQLADCPHLPAELAAAAVETDKARKPFEPGVEYVKQLRAEVANLDLAAAAARVGGTFNGQQLTLKVLGKDFRVDTAGNLSADIHINPWVAVPVLNYILHSEGLPPANVWVTLRELQKGRERYPLFQRQCEEPLKRVADSYPELFDDLVNLFSGHRAAQHLNSDISVVLLPLPKVPIMICYWRPDDGLDSSLNVFFDVTADRNLDTDSVYTLGVGLAHMLKKIASRHGGGAQQRRAPA